MTEPPAEGGCCRCILSFTVTSALAAVFIWLSFRPSKPTLSIQQFYLFALNTTTTTNNHTIFYDLKLNNNNDDKGVFYDPLNLTFYYNHGNSSVFTPFGSGNFTGFYQGHGKHAERAGVVVLKGGQGGDGVFETLSKNGVEVVVFRVEVATALRYKIVFWKTKRKRFVVGGEFKVDDHGVLVKRKKHKGIKLSNCGGVGIIIIKGLFKVLITLIISLLVVLHLV